MSFSDVRKADLHMEISRAPCLGEAVMLTEMNWNISACDRLWDMTLNCSQQRASSLCEAD